MKVAYQQRKVHREKAEWLERAMSAFVPCSSTRKQIATGKKHTHTKNGGGGKQRKNKVPIAARTWKEQ